METPNDPRDPSLDPGDPDDNVDENNGVDGDAGNIDELAVPEATDD